VTIELFKDVDKSWRFHIVADNGQIIATSEAYSSKRQCMDTVKSLLGLTLTLKTKKGKA